VSGSHNSRHPTFRRAIIKAQRAVRAAAHRRATIGAAPLDATSVAGPMLEGLAVVMAVTIVGRPAAAKGEIFGVAPALVARGGIFAGAHPVAAILVVDLGAVAPVATSAAAPTPVATGQVAATTVVAIRAQRHLRVSRKATALWRKPGLPR